METTASKLKNQFLVTFALTKRHFLVFVKNAPTVLFTLMVPMVILVVYALFLRPMELAQIKPLLPSELISNTEDVRKVYGLVDTWMFSGVLAVSCITVSLNTCCIQVQDKERGVSKDFISSPIHSSSIMLSYFFFNMFVTFVVNLIVYFICLIYLVAYGAFLITALDFFAIIGVILFSTISASLITFFICSFINSESVLSAVLAIFSAAIGFLIGAYLPTNMLPKGITFLTTFFPGTYSAGLLRNYFMSSQVTQLENLLNTKYASYGAEDIINNIKSNFSFNLNFFGEDVPPLSMVIAITVFIIVFLVLNMIFSSSKYLNLSKVKNVKLKRKNDKPLEIEHKTEIPSPINLENEKDKIEKE